MLVNVQPPPISDSPRNVRVQALVADAMEIASGDPDQATLDLLTAAALAAQAMNMRGSVLHGFIDVIQDQPTAARTRAAIRDMLRHGPAGEA